MQIYLILLLGVTVGLIFLIPLLLRRVVPTNEVHIVQSRNKTTSYGKDMAEGNTYYEWPSSLPIIGITKTVLPVSVFDLDLAAYEAYDKGRLPFVVDVKAFFRITNSDIAAQRVSDFEELQHQLKAVVQGAVRTILASSEIEEIMQGRSKFGDEFTKEVEAQLANWGVSTVKNIEMMDIRDNQNSHVIRNIMEKKKSHIEMESRREVAKNQQEAQIAETIAQKETELKKQEAQQEIGQRKAEAAKQIGVSEQIAVQEIKEQERKTKDKEMSVVQVHNVRTSEIEREVAIIKADQEKQKVVLAAEAKLEANKKEAEAIKIQGDAKADAEKAMQLAPVAAQITLAKEIGENQNYQTYLLSVRRIEADQAIGIEQANALKQADLKIIANSGDVTNGINKLSDIISTKGGSGFASMLEGLAQSEAGLKLLNKFTGNHGDTSITNSN